MTRRPPNRGMIRLAPPPPWRLPSPARPRCAQKREGADIGEKQQDLQQTQKRLNEERQKAADAKKREAGLLAELESIDKRVTDKRKQVVTLDGRIKKAQADIGDLQADIGKLGRQRLGQEEVLERRLRALYKLEAQGGALPLLLSGDDPVAKAVQLRHLTTLATVDARLIREYRVTSEGLAERKSRLEARQKDLTGLRSEVDEERAEADREAAKRQVLLARVKDERAYHDRMVGELSEAARRLEAFIRDLQERAAQGGGGGQGDRLRAARSRPAPPIDARLVYLVRDLLVSGAGCPGRRTAGWSENTGRKFIRGSEPRRSGTGSTSMWRKARASRPWRRVKCCTRAGSVDTAT